MRMEEDRMRRMGKVGTRYGTRGQGPQGMALENLGKTRGFLMNPKPGSQAQGFNAAMDRLCWHDRYSNYSPSYGLTLFKGN
ncbi:MAG: hypothetical protein Ct9H300mP27_03780 [Chloroflexota bacterium]|nr:MAG: hypothetical protein Ct9H300mP27_03780 [Chloroflexota bacterium]